MNFLNSLLLIEGVVRTRAGAGVGVRPGMGVQKRTSKVKKEPILLVKVFKGALISSLLLELIGKKL